MADRHDWNNWEQYQHIHHSYLAGYLDHFVMEDRLSCTPTPEVIDWRGVLLCVDGFEVNVRKTLTTRILGGQVQVRTVDYSYHAIRRVQGIPVNLFRYDNAHAHTGHADPHHRHRFDVDGNEIVPPQYIGADDWPTLVLQPQMGMRGLWRRPAAR